ncbi:MAG TPA: AzlD domain-containing protein [Egibacteraceae bacterium]|nr:AzlD domain-containing protein [Egibacteraceae bacterium]
MIVSVSVAALVTRGLFLVPRTTWDPPPLVAEMLRLLPPAAFAGLAVPALLRPAGSLDLVSPGMIAAVLALVVAWRTRSIAATLGVGLVSVLALEQLFRLA